AGATAQSSSSTLAKEPGGSGFKQQGLRSAQRGDISHERLCAVWAYLAAAIGAVLRRINVRLFLCLLLRKLRGLDHLRAL
ncbi:MAG: hypothetical protein ACK559_21300, partial [bacterium]